MAPDVSEGDRITFEPKGGSEFPTGERTRSAEVEAVRGDEIIIRQSDGFADRISASQIVG